MEERLRAFDAMFELLNAKPADGLSFADHYEPVTKPTSDEPTGIETCAGSSEAAILCHVAHYNSPDEFFLRRACDEDFSFRLANALSEFYSDPERGATVPTLADRSGVREELPCAVKFSGDERYYRAKVVHVGMDDCMVQFVDIGDCRFCPLTEAKRLCTEFATFPPMVVQCTIKGLDRRELWANRVKDFRDELADLDFVILAVFRQEEVERGRFHVSLYHPDTKAEIGAHMYDKGDQLRKKRIKKLAKRKEQKRQEKLEEDEVEYDYEDVV